MRANDLAKNNIAYHKTLCPKVWKGSKLRPEVRYKLLAIAKQFIEYLDTPSFKLLDVYLRGSLANYNYTDYSDFDLHLVTDFDKLDCDITEAYYKAKKQIWNDQHDIIIRDHDVELYVEDNDEVSASETLYSVLDDRWIKEPNYNKPSFDTGAINHKVQDLITQIEDAIYSEDPTDLARLKDKILIMRKSGLSKEGEYSVENLVFKILRNQKYIDKLNQALLAKQDSEFSLVERKKKRRRKISRYPASMYYGYYWGGANNNDNADAGGGDGGGGESLSEGWKSNAVIAALVSALSSPAAADYNYPNNQQKEISPVGQALIIYKKLFNMQKYGQAGLEGEATQEFNNIMRAIQGHPNQSKLFPIIKDVYKNPEKEELPPLYDPSYTPPKDDVNESQARLDPEVEDFLEGLTPDDVGYDEVGDYIVHYEGFTDQCQDSEEYQDNPQAVFDNVWSDFKRRMGNKDPINYGIIGSEEYPIVYSVFRR